MFAFFLHCLHWLSVIYNPKHRRTPAKEGVLTPIHSEELQGCELEVPPEMQMGTDADRSNWELLEMGWCMVMRIRILSILTKAEIQMR